MPTYSDSISDNSEFSDNISSIISITISDGTAGSLLPKNRRRIISQYGLPFTINPAPNGFSDSTDRIHVSGYVNLTSIGAYFEDDITPSIFTSISDNSSFADAIIPVFPMTISDNSIITDSNVVAITAPISSDSEFSDVNDVTSIVSDTISDNNVKTDILAVRTTTPLQETQIFVDSNFSYITTTNVEPTTINDTNDVIFDANASVSNDSSFSQTLNSGMYTSITDDSNLADSIIVRITTQIDESFSSSGTADVISLFEETIVEGNQYQYFGDSFGSKYLDYWGDYFGHYDHFHLTDSQAASFPVYETESYIDAIDVEGSFNVSNTDNANYTETLIAVLNLTESDSFDFQETISPVLSYTVNPSDIISYIDAIDVEGSFNVSNTDSANYTETLIVALNLTESDAILFSDELDVSVISGDIPLLGDTSDVVSFGDALNVNMISHISMSENIEIDIPQTVMFTSLNEFIEYHIGTDVIAVNFTASTSILDDCVINGYAYKHLDDSISDSFTTIDRHMLAHIRRINIQRCHVKQHTPLKVYHYIIDGYKYKLKDNIVLFLDDRLLNKTSTLNNKLLAQKITQELATIVKWDHGVIEFQDDRIGSIYIDLDNNSIHNYSDGRMNIIINGSGNIVDDNYFIEYEENDTVILFKNNVITKVDLTYIDEM